MTDLHLSQFSPSLPTTKTRSVFPHLVFFIYLCETISAKEEDGIDQKIWASLQIGCDGIMANGEGTRDQIQGILLSAIFEIVQVITLDALDTIIDETAQSSFSSSCETTLQGTCATVLP